MKIDANREASGKLRAEGEFGISQDYVVVGDTRQPTKLDAAFTANVLPDAQGRPERADVSFSADADSFSVRSLRPVVLNSLNDPRKLLAEVRRLLTAPQTLTLDLGNGVTMEFVYIRPGTFVMGGERTTEGRFEAVEVPKHTVTVTKGFYLGKYEVTQAQYQAIMGQNPSRSAKDPNCPVDSTQWNGEIEFCKKVSQKTGREVRLPTEAEWEYACRAGTDTQWSHGSNPALLAEYAWIADNSGGASHPVGQKKQNPWGLYDMHENVCERVADLYHRDYYASSPKEDLTGAKVAFARGASGTTILRGGTWKSNSADCSSGARLRGGGYGFYENWGFRAAVAATGDDTATSTPPAASKEAFPRKQSVWSRTTTFDGSGPIEKA
ncbi:MAG: formylglycine-generating enzyme family protein [Planctomycetota bacterium]|nr:formylglycine-generating enzyme family protein [Planctomycetota bacterium]